MNKDRRKTIDEARDLIERAKALLEQAAGEEEEYRDNLPESFQSGDRGQKADAACDALNETVSNLEEALSGCETAAE